MATRTRKQTSTAPAAGSMDENWPTVSPQVETSDAGKKTPLEALAGAPQTPAEVAHSMTEGKLQDAINEAINKSALAGRVALLEEKTAATGERPRFVPASRPEGTAPALSNSPRPYDVRLSIPGGDGPAAVEVYLPKNPTQPWLNGVEWEQSSSDGEDEEGERVGGGWHVVPGAAYGDNIYLTTKAAKGADKVLYTLALETPAGGGQEPYSRVMMQWSGQVQFIGSADDETSGVEAALDEGQTIEPGVLKDYESIVKATIKKKVENGELVHTVLVAYYYEDVHKYVTLPGDHLNTLTNKACVLELCGGSGGGVAVDSPVPWEVRLIDGDWWIYSPTVKYTTLSNLWGVQTGLPWTVYPAGGKDGVKVTTPVGSENDATGLWLQLTNADTDVSAKQLQATYNKKEGTVELEFVTGASEEITSVYSWVVGSFSIGGKWSSNIVGAVSVDITRTTPPMVKTVTGSGSSESASLSSDVGNLSRVNKVFLGVTYWVEALIVGGAVRFAKATEQVASQGVSLGVRRPVWIDPGSANKMQVGGYAAFFSGASDAVTTVAEQKSIATVKSLSYTEPTEDHQRGKLGSMNQTHYTWVYQASSAETESVYLYTEVEDANNDGGEDPTNPYTDQGTNSASLVYQHGE